MWTRKNHRLKNKGILPKFGDWSLIEFAVWVGMDILLTCAVLGIIYIVWGVF